MYFKVRKPDLIILVRHGESEANVDSSKYRDVGDPHIALTPRGQQQAHHAGNQLCQLVGSRHIFAYVSPYARTRQTADLALSHLSADERRVVRRIEDPRLREREFCGTFQHEKPDRKRKPNRTDTEMFRFVTLTFETRFWNMEARWNKV